MAIDDLKDLFDFEDYCVRTNTNYSNLTFHDALLIAIHHSGDSKNIIKKLHLNEELSILESLFVDSFINVIKKLPKPKELILNRNEIEDDSIIESYKSKVKNCLKHSIPFSTKSFWNFTENVNWPMNNTLSWKVTLSENTKAGAAYHFYYPVEKLYTDELEVIFPPYSNFKVKEYSENLIDLIELD